MYYLYIYTPHLADSYVLIICIALLSVSDEIESNKQKAIELSNKLFQPEQLKEALKRGGLPEANR